MARGESMGSAIGGFAMATALTLLPALWLGAQTMDALRTTTIVCDHAAGDACDIEVRSLVGTDTQHVPNDAIESVDVGTGGSSRSGWNYTLTLTTGGQTQWLGHPDSEEHADAWVAALWAWHTDPSAAPVHVVVGERSWVFALMMGVFALALGGAFLGILWGTLVGWGKRGA